MNRFEKVSFEQYAADRGDFPKEQLMEEYEAIIMPRRSTPGSAGYDIHTPFDVELKPGCSVVIPTGLRIQMNDGLWLGIFIRSSLGFRYQVRLCNSVSVIDSDYYGADNEGHLKSGLYNAGTRPLILHRGDAFAQGILLPYLLMDDDDPVPQQRTGGFGSTNRTE